MGSFILLWRTAASAAAGTVTAALPGFPAPVLYDKGRSQDGKEKENYEYIGSIHDYMTPNTRQSSLITRAVIHAIRHCQITTPTAHLPPNSRRIEAIAATQGV